MKNQPFTWDFERSNKIVSEVQLLYFTTSDRQTIEVKNSSKPIKVAIRNIPENVLGQNISLSLPKDVQIKSLKLTSTDCNMLLKFTPLNDPSNLTTLIVYIQYGKIPTQNDYDLKINVSNEGGTTLTKNLKPFVLSNNMEEYIAAGSQINKTLILHRNQNAQLLKDGSLILWDFQNSTYSNINRTILYLSFYYTGPMPKAKVESNLYTFSEIEFSGSFDYEMKSFCVECNYWSEFKNEWMSDGCEV